MELNILLYLAIILVSGLVFGRLAKLVRLAMRAEFVAR